MEKYIINKEQDIVDLKNEVDFSFTEGDIIVHKPLEYYILVGYMKKHFPDIELFPASPGTPVYALNGYNTSVVKSITTGEISS